MQWAAEIRWEGIERGWPAGTVLQRTGQPLPAARRSPTHMGNGLGPQFDMGKARGERGDYGELTKTLFTNGEGEELTRGSVGRTGAPA